MAKSYRPYLPEQDLLLPPSLRDWLPESHLAYFVSDVLDQVDLSAIESYYEKEERGYPPYHPRMMTKILVYGYCVGVFSSRRLQKRLQEDVGFRVLAAGNQPDFRTISDFRKLHLAALDALFQQVLRMALELGAMKLGQVAIDGSKLKANASKHKAMSPVTKSPVVSNETRNAAAAATGAIFLVEIQQYASRALTLPFCLPAVPLFLHRLTGFH